MAFQLNQGKTCSLPQDALSPTLSLPIIHECRWGWCRLVFPTASILKKHVIQDHIRKSQPIPHGELGIFRKQDDGVGESLGLSAFVGGSQSVVSPQVEANSSKEDVPTLSRVSWSPRPQVRSSSSAGALQPHSTTVSRLPIRVAVPPPSRASVFLNLSSECDSPFMPPAPHSPNQESQAAIRGDAPLPLLEPETSRKRKRHHRSGSDSTSQSDSRDQRNIERQLTQLMNGVDESAELDIDLNAGTNWHFHTLDFDSREKRLMERESLGLQLQDDRAQKNLHSPSPHGSGTLFPSQDQSQPGSQLPSRPPSGAMPDPSSMSQNTRFTSSDEPFSLPNTGTQLDTPASINIQACFAQSQPRLQARNESPSPQTHTVPPLPPSEQLDTIDAPPSQPPVQVLPPGTDDSSGGKIDQLQRIQSYGLLMTQAPYQSQSYSQ